MYQLWFICVIVLTLVKQNTATKQTQRDSVSALRHEFPSPKIQSKIKSPKNQRNIEARLAQDSIEQYQDMMKGSQESFEMFEDRDNKRLRRLIGDDDFDLMAEAGGLPRRRFKLQSAAVQRRARSQVIRRNKLAAQGLRSHKLHSRLFNKADYDFV